ncbi:MAG: YajQ family cyclic di-GMP-binding protein [Candidatus Wallbacteria bacterium]
MPSFDVVSQVNGAEIDNAINQAMKEIQQRFDFKGSISEVKREGEKLSIAAEDEYRLKSVIDLFQDKLTKRKVPLNGLKFGKIESALGGTVKQYVDIVAGIETDIAKEMVKDIKNTKLKVQASIQEKQVRVSGKNRDDLQTIIQFLKSKDYKLPLQFINFREN